MGKKGNGPVRILWVTTKNWLWLCGWLGFLPFAWSQTLLVTVSGKVKTEAASEPVAFTQVMLFQAKDSVLAAGTVTDESGNFSLSGIKPGNYRMLIRFVGCVPYDTPLFIGSASSFLSLPDILLKEKVAQLQEVQVTGRAVEVSSQMDKKTYEPDRVLSQQGGSVLQAMQNLPGVTIQDGKVQLRGNDKVVVLIDGKQTSLTGMGGQSGLENLAASGISKIEIIQNPGARYDANGNGGIINLVMRKEQAQGWAGKMGLAGGVGALWIKRENEPGIRRQYQATPKINPSLFLNYRKANWNAFFQADNLYTHTLNKNEFVRRSYEDGTLILQQLKRNRNTNFLNTKAGFDWNPSTRETLTASILFGSEKILDRGDQPFYVGSSSQPTRLWQFLEDELKTTLMGSASYQYRFSRPGEMLNANLNYTYHRENEKYFFTNQQNGQSGTDAFALLSDDHVADLNLDYERPLRYGRLETGIKGRFREIPTAMKFKPGLNSVIDSNAGGPATYRETIPAAYGSYFFETEHWDAELGLRVEWVQVNYLVPAGHPTYKSNGYQYFQPFPNTRIGYKLSENQKLSLYLGRRVDRPNEVDIRIFPKYDDAEIIKVGNPGLRPQFTNRLELSYKQVWNKGYFYLAAFLNASNGTIARIASTSGDSKILYAVFQNANRSYNSGVEWILSQDLGETYRVSLNATAFHNQIDGFRVTNLYPKPTEVRADKEEIYSWNLKVNQQWKPKPGWECQLNAVYLGPDLIPQGRIKARFTLDAGIKKSVGKGKSEFFFNGTDLLNTFVLKKEVKGNGFQYSSYDYYETQVFRLGWSRKF